MGPDARRRRAADGRVAARVRHGQLAHYKIPRYVRVVDEFPMTVTGKVRKVEMREKTVAELGLAGQGGSGRKAP